MQTRLRREEKWREEKENEEGGRKRKGEHGELREDEGRKGSG